MGLFKDKNEQNVTVNFFEQGDLGKVRRLDDRNDFETSLADRGGILDTRMNELETQLQQAKTLVDTLTQLAKEIKEEEKETENEHNDSLTLTDDPELLEIGGNTEIKETRAKSYQLPIYGWRTLPTNTVIRFNKVLDRAYHQHVTGGVKERTIIRLWGFYSRIRHMLVSRWDVVPEAAWALLWNVFSAETEVNPNRMSHTYLLSKDMQSAGITLTDDQQLLAIEAMFIDGWREEALKNHRGFAGTLGVKKETFTRYWQLGLRMYCQVGDLDRAQRVVDTLVDAPYPYENDPRVLLPFIRACAADADPASVERGFQAYRNLRDMLGTEMTKVDYDQVIAFYLVANQTEYALYVFVDMMTSGDLDIYRKERLPMAVTNPFFIGKWLKRLISGGDLQGAHNVLLYLMKRGIVARPIQVNALVGSLLRSQAADNVRLAENIAWGMINSRIQFVHNRQKMRDLDKSIKLRPHVGWPDATLETFKILAENYKTRAMHPKMEELWEAFREAELAPDVFMMNQLLFSLLHDGQGEQVPELFYKLKERHNIKPDRHTFFALWQSLPVNRLWSVPTNELPQEARNCRDMFAVIVASASTFGEEGIDAQFGERILHAFRKAGDKPGLLVATRALRYVFHSPPTESIIMKLLVGTTYLEKALKKEAPNRDFMLHLKRIEKFLGHRKKELEESGERWEDTDLETFRRDEFCNYYELHLETEGQDPQNARRYPEGWDRALQKAVEDMGLSEISQNAETSQDTSGVDSE